MDAMTLGWMGAIAGTLIGIAGAVFGCWSSYRSAENDAQRALLRRSFVWTGFAGVVFIALIFGASTGFLPWWMYWVTMAAVFLPLGFWIRWMNRRLAELSTAARE